MPPKIQPNGQNIAPKKTMSDFFKSLCCCTVSVRINDPKPPVPLIDTNQVDYVQNQPSVFETVQLPKDSNQSTIGLDSVKQSQRKILGLTNELSNSSFDDVVFKSVVQEDISRDTKINKHYELTGELSSSSFDDMVFNPHKNSIKINSNNLIAYTSKNCVPSMQQTKVKSITTIAKNPSINKPCKSIQPQRKQ